MKPAVGSADLAGDEAGRESSWQQPVGLDTLRALWQAAFDAAEAALKAASSALPPDELRERSARLSGERETTRHLLEALAHDEGAGARFSMMIPRWDARRVLGLPPGITACVFNLNGVLLGSTQVHRAAWKETFDEFISARIDRTGGQFAPFNPRTDYEEHIHGKPRLEGVRAFLAARGISLPEGHLDDPPGTETVHGLANRKNEALLRRLDEQGVNALEGSRRYLEIARDLGVRRAVVSASANTPTILERAGLTALIDASVDGNTISARQLRAKPAPDTLLAACRQLGVEPLHAAVFETSPAGVAAARAGGFAQVIGVDRSGRPDVLRAAGADVVVEGLSELLERNLAARA